MKEGTYLEPVIIQRVKKISITQLCVIYIPARRSSSSSSSSWSRFDKRDIQVRCGSCFKKKKIHQRLIQSWNCYNVALCSRVHILERHQLQENMMQYKLHNDSSSSSSQWCIYIYNTWSRTWWIAARVWTMKINRLARSRWWSVYITASPNSI